MKGDVQPGRLQMLWSWEFQVVYQGRERGRGDQVGGEGVVRERGRELGYYITIVFVYSKFYCTCIIIHVRGNKEE